MSAVRNKRVLSLNLHGLGDFVISLPVLSELARAGCGPITGLVWPALQEVAACVPALDRVVPLPRDRENEPELSAFVREVAGDRGFDLLLDFSFQPRAGRIAAAVAAPRTVGFGIDQQEHPCYTDSIPNLDRELRLHRNLRIPGLLGLKAPGRPDFPVRVPEASARRVESLLASSGVDLAHSRPVAVHPGSGVRRRNWPPERFAALADRIAVHTGEPVLLLGGRGRTYDGTDESEVAAGVEAAMSGSPVNLAGMLTLPELVCLLARCSLFVGNNSGPAHLACSVAGVPCLLVWAPRNERLWMPYGAPVELVVAETHCSRDCLLNKCEDIQYCLARIGPDEVFERYLKTLAPAAAGGRA
ncbi:MAG: glycosyltransferase family 9 protein [Candidatus Glassbacteria bacterium]|nr:glycosyltransferase family 9 protein [Candidatus Glassbacteria bacterium]